MDVTAPTSPANRPIAGANPQNRVISSDFETFLKMLTAQMQNQDPLNPIQSSDYAVQLATFSGVEQQVRTNDLLASLGQQLGAAGLAQAAAWVGMEARVAAPARFDGAPITLYPGFSANADAGKIVVTDETGTIVSRQSIDPNSGPFSWAGVGSDGQPLPPGFYSFTVESYVNGALDHSQLAQTYSLVKEARIENGKRIILLESGATANIDDVTALRMP